MSDRPDPIATSSQTVGPFFHFGLTANEGLGRIAPPQASGEHIQLRVRVLDGDAAPVPDAIVEIYQADAEGEYPAAQQPREFSGFGRLATGPDGWCVFETIKPGAVRTGTVEQAPHFNVCLLARGLLRQIYTRIYLPDPRLAADPILSLVAPDRRPTLIAQPSAGAVDTWDFVVRLQAVGDSETVFFDL